MKKKSNEKESCKIYLKVQTDINYYPKQTFQKQSSFTSVVNETFSRRPNSSLIN